MAKKTSGKQALDILRHPEEDQRAKQAVRMANILGILERLLQRSKWNISQLATDLELSERTVHRYLDVLEIAGVPFYYDAHEKCYQVRPGYTFPILNLTPDELLGQAAASTIGKAMGLEAASTEAVARKIAASSRLEIAELLGDAQAIISVCNLSLAAPSRHQETIRTIQWACVEQRQLTGEYQSPHEPEPLRAAFHPYRLVLTNRAWYLIARVDGEPGPRTFRVGRFSSLRMTDAKADVPRDFNLDVYFVNAWGVFRGGNSYDIEIEFVPEVAQLVTETPLHRTQQVRRHRDGRVTLTFKVDGLEEILRWVLGWTGRAKVMKPPELRQMVVEHLRAALQLHDIQ